MNLSKRLSIFLVILSLILILVGLAIKHGFLFQSKDKEVVTPRTDLIQMLDIKSPSEVLSILSERIIDDEKLANICHGVAHDIGHHAYEKYGFEQAMSYENDVCGAGYIHGVVEEHFGLTNEEKIIDVLNTVCVLNNSPRCYHGVGHGLMFATQSDVSKSLGYCDSYKEVFKKSNCYDGVFMQIFDDEDTGVDKPDVPFTDPFLFCSNFLTPYNSNCYFYAPRYEIFKDTAESLSKKCSLIASPSMQATCAIGSGVGFMKYHITKPQEGEEFCSIFGNSEMQEHCFEGLVRYYNFHNQLNGNSNNICKEEGIQKKDKCYDIVKHMGSQASVSQ